MAQKPQDEAKKARLAEALRANLQRRKKQARQRASGAGEAAPVDFAVNPPQSPPKAGG